MKKQKGFINLEVMVVMFVIVIVIGSGWVLNLKKLTELDFEAPYKAEVIRTISILPPIGVFTGWMDIGEENIEETK